MKDRIIMVIISLVLGIIIGVQSTNDNNCKAELISVKSQNEQLIHKLERADEKREVFSLFAKFIDKIPFEQAVPSNEIKLNK